MTDTPNTLKSTLYLGQKELDRMKDEIRTAIEILTDFFTNGPGKDQLYAPDHDNAQLCAGPNTPHPGYYWAITVPNGHPVFKLFRNPDGDQPEKMLWHHTRIWKKPENSLVADINREVEVLLQWCMRRFSEFEGFIQSYVLAAAAAE